MNKNERMNKLNAYGIDTKKYFTFDLPQGIKPGAKISLVIDENGQPQIVNDTISEQIIEDGYVRNTKLHRRYVMAQMFHMLNYKSYDGKDSGYSACLRRNYAYQYTIDMMIEEVRVLSKLEAKDAESFAERSHFFTRDVVVEVMNDYLNKLKAYVDSLPNRKCKGVPYKRVKGRNIFVTDLDKKLYLPVENKIRNVKRMNNYAEMYGALYWFRHSMIKLPWDTSKSSAWVDAFKGNGAYYTLKNLLMFHNCYVENESGVKLYGANAVSFINRKLDEYQDEGWRMFALMKKVIADNGFDFDQRMRDIYGE